MLKRLASIAALYPAGLVALSVVHGLAPRRAGLRAMSQLFAPHLFLAAVPLAPVAVVARSRALCVALAVAGLVGLARFGPRPRRPSLDPGGPSVRIDVLSWNALADHRPASAVVEAMLGSDATLVAIQEVTSAVAMAVADDPILAARFPHRLLAPRDHDVLGMGLFSAYPMLHAGQSQRPPRQWATLALADGARLTVINAHPVPPKIKVRQIGPFGVPVVYDPAARDHAIRRIRALIDGYLSGGDQVLIVGDFNLTDREPAYPELSAGLVDSQRAVGSWPGSTWQPRALFRLPVGFLRIDHLFAGPGVRPVSVRIERESHGSDHHPIHATFVIRPPAAG